MSRGPPPRIAPLVADGLRYEAPWTARGTVVAFDEKSGQEQWRLLVVHRFIDEQEETDVQQVFIKSMALTPSGQALHLVDEGGLEYLVDLQQRSAKLLTWRMGVRLLSSTPSKQGWRYRVELSTTNVLDRVLQLDGPSVAEGGTLANDLFRVTVDGRPVSFHGMMAKRAPPERFIELRPGERYVTEVELGDAYPVPPGKHRVTIAFEHTNHFSREGFTMKSAPVDVKFTPD